MDRSQIPTIHSILFRRVSELTKGRNHQNFAPLKQICAHLNAFHVYASDPKRCVESNHYCAHLNEGEYQATTYPPYALQPLTSHPRRPPMPNIRRSRPQRPPNRRRIYDLRHPLQNPILFRAQALALPRLRSKIRHVDHARPRRPSHWYLGRSRNKRNGRRSRFVWEDVSFLAGGSGR